MKSLNDSLEGKVVQRTNELSKANEYLEKLAITDPLTGLPNRRHAIDQLSFYWNESKSKKLPLSCIMIDIDYFKAINDNYGHDIGDLILTEFSTNTRENLRTDDVFCRLGGDEFIVICPNTDRFGVLKVANYILERTLKLKVPVDSHMFWNGSLSIGVASNSADMKTYENLIKQADIALYSAKSAGKNCVSSGK